MRTMWNDCLTLIEKAKRVAVFSHRNTDGDALGSAYALAASLARGGKAVCVFTGEEYPDNLQFLVYEDDGVKTVRLCEPTEKNCTDSPLCDTVPSPDAFDLAVAVDCATAERIAPRCREVFMNCPAKIRIDHHLPCEGSDFADVNIADSSWAAASEGLWDFLKIYCDGVRCKKPDYEIAVRLYTGILTDTGKFVYTSTTGNTFRTVGELVDITGSDLNHIARSLFDIKKPRVTKLISKVYSEVELLFGGRVAYVYLSLEDFEAAEALQSDANAIPPALMNIEDVEIAVFARQYADGSDGRKVSMRCVSGYNVAEICNVFGGGGHACASGCSLHGTPESVREKIIKEIEKII